MWGNLILDASSQYNYNFGFSTHKSDVLLHLAQWQYWWWFWFSLLWVFYFYIIYFVLANRTAEFNPTLNSSLRSHGKWGDFLVCLIPLSWCGNILLNSNFILRMLEWQSEGSLFVVRVQGKQWYWVYKFDNTLYSSLVSAPRNIGDNNWVVNTPTGSLNFDNYYQAAQLTAQVEFNARQLTDLKGSSIRSTDTSLTAQHLPLKTSLYRHSLIIDKLNYESATKNITCLTSYKQNKLLTQTIKLIYLKDKLTLTPNSSVGSVVKKKVFTSTIDKLHPSNLELTDTIRYMSKAQPLKILKSINLTVPSNANLITSKFNYVASTATEKTQQLETYWGFRQKKYARRDAKKFKFKPQIVYSPITLQEIGISTPDHKYRYMYSYLQSRELVRTYDSKNYSSNDPINYYNAIRINRLRSDSIPTTLSKRLLRVRRTLVLPAHTNITVITNSYDVVHSWFIPGLGIKLDCVPGRSTHHTFYIDNVGFYYGQCAEICGRYHHHMPIRVCALPYEHFVIWWQTRGLPRMRRFSGNNGLVYNTSKVQI